MTFYFYDLNDIMQTFAINEFKECLESAKNDRTVHKFRDSQGGEYHI